MNLKEVYFKDNFFSVGETEIFNQDKELLGYLDLESVFTSSLTVYSAEREPLLKGSFRFFSNKWLITNLRTNSEIGLVRPRFAFFEKRFEYQAYGKGVYEIISPVFSREYSIKDQAGQSVADFERVNNFFASAAFKLNNSSNTLSWIELVTVIMGVNQIQKRQRNSANSTN